jgi:hypothetical protein
MDERIKRNIIVWTRILWMKGLSFSGPELYG